MKSLILFLIRAYQKFLSPRKGLLKFLYQSPIFNLFPGVTPGCRFSPSCSRYSLKCVRKYGVIKGGLLSLKRISRCWSL